jgi:hypothetical protein
LTSTEQQVIRSATATNQKYKMRKRKEKKNPEKSKKHRFLSDEGPYALAAALQP